MDKVKYSVEDRIGIVIFDNPKTLNALDFDSLDEMNNVLNEVESDSDVKCLILTGGGEKAFIAGGDIQVQSTFDVIHAYDWACFGHSILDKIDNLRIPVIGAINGYALGGGMEVALTCDILIASEQAVFGQPEVTLGITPGFGGTQRLPRKIGINRANELIFTGRNVSAQEALAYGLVNKIVPHEDLMRVSREIAESIIRNSAPAIRLAKIAITDGMKCELDRGLSLERALFSECFATEEQKVAMQAFLDRKKGGKSV